MLCIAKIILKLLAFAEFLFRQVFPVRNAHRELQDKNRSQSEIPDSQLQTCHEDMIEQNSLQPCWQRLQQLEALVNELNKKPTNIPPEKEDMLLESLSRIRSIEYDLQKTKKVSSNFHAS